MGLGAMRTREDIAAYRSAVPLALVSDIHGNDVALAAVVAELERLGIERAVCLGDAAQGRIPFDRDAFVDAGLAAGQPYAAEVPSRWRSAF